MHTISRTIDASPARAWQALSTPSTWPHWAPIIADVDVDVDTIETGSTGEILVVPGVWLPFHVTSVNRRSRSWVWRVAGGPEIDHRVSAAPGRRGGSIVSFIAPLWFPGHHVVTRLALWHLDAYLHEAAA